MSSTARRYAAVQPAAAEHDAELDAALDDVLAHDFGSELTRLRTAHAQLRSVAAGGPDESVETQSPRRLHSTTSEDHVMTLSRDSNAVPSIFHPEWRKLGALLSSPASSA